MIVGIDASFLRKQNTGLGQVTTNFLKKLMEISSTKLQLSSDKDVEFILYLEEDAEFELPENAVSAAARFQKKAFLPPYKRDDIIRAIWWQRYLLPKKAKSDGCDVFLSMYQCATIMPKSIKHLMIVHDVLLEFFPEYLNNFRKKYFWRISKKAIKKADKIIAVSHRTEKDLVQQLNIDPKKITVLYIDIDQIYKKDVTQAENERVMQKYGLQPGYIYNGGGLEVRKNTENVLRAYKILLGSFGHASWLPKLVISGKMMPELSPLISDVEQLVEGLELQEYVHLLGFVPQEDLPAVYKNAKIFVYPSRYEGFGLPVLESMNIGTPVVTSKTSSLPEVGNDAAVYCDPDSVDDLAMVMKNILNNEHLQATLSLRGKERALRFSWEKFTEKMLHIISDIK